MPEDDEGTGWLEQRLDQMDSALSLLTAKLDSIPNGNLSPEQAEAIAAKITALTTMLDNLTSQNKELRDQIAALQTKAETLETSLIRRQRRQPTPESENADAPKAAPTNAPPEPTPKPKSRNLRAI